MLARGLGSLVLVVALTGCGGDDADKAANSFGDVAFSTYEYSRTRLIFTNDSSAKRTWANMAGPPVIGTYTKNGNEIEIQWDPAADHLSSASEKYRQVGPCSMARYIWVDKEGVEHDDSPQIYERNQPRCDTVRVTN